MESASMKLIAMGTLLLASVAQAAKPAAPTQLVSDAALANAGLTLFWEARLPVATSETLKEAFLRDEALYVTTDRGAIYALHAETGLLRWGQNLTEPAYRIFAPTHVQQADARGPVVIPTTTRVFIFDRYSGQKTTCFAPEFPISSPSVAYDDSVLMGSTNGHFYSFIVDPQRCADPVMRWEVTAGGPIQASPILYGNRNLLIASRSGAIVSCFAPDKSLNWQYRAGGAVLADPVVDASGIYIPCMDRSLYKLNADNGAFIWRALFSSPLSTGPTVAAQTIYQFCPDRGVTALDAITGEQKWRNADADSFVSHSASGDILFGTPGRLFIVDHEKGERMAEVEVPRVRHAVANPANDAAYLLGDQGRVLCIRLDKVPYLRRQQIIMAQQQLNLPPVDESARGPNAAPTTRTTDRTSEDPFRSRRDKP
jgi:outer membrane protein assembly factor BamB